MGIYQTQIKKKEKQNVPWKTFMCDFVVVEM